MNSGNQWQTANFSQIKNNPGEIEWHPEWFRIHIEKNDWHLEMYVIGTQTNEDCLS